MEKYDYRRSIIEDIKRYIKENPHKWADPMVTDNIEEYWYDILWAEDCITGNGYYWYNTEEKCEEYLSSNIDLGLEACEEFSVDLRALLSAASQKNAARYLDCTIRCYLLGECLHEALEEMNNE